MISQEILTVVEKANLLGYFKKICEQHNTCYGKRRLRNILTYSTAPEQTIRCMLPVDDSLTREETDYLYMLLWAFLNKSSCRKPIRAETKLSLLAAQRNRCNICGKVVDMSGHADHIIPFKYVGDELEDNLQILCDHCNSAKSAHLDYELKRLLCLI